MKNNNLEKAEKQMRRGVLELCILSVIAEQEIYTSDILKRLEDTDLLVVEGTLYPLLTRLKNAGMLQYTWRESTQGPPRKYYSITEQGKLFLNGLLQTWNQLVLAVNNTTKNLTINE
jgi:PadR family transcriptional regulator PadR